MKPSFLPLPLAILVTLPGTFARLADLTLSAPTEALLSGMAILGASFLLLWACDAAQADIPQALALAVVALIAVLPEYAVDMYFTWQAGKFPDSDYAHYAIANMTGANRLLIGVAWGVIALVGWVRSRRDVQLDPVRRTELAFLAMATAYAFLIPIKGTLAWYDGIVFLGIYAWYIYVASKQKRCECEDETGVVALLLGLPARKRRAATMALFLFSAGVILANAEPFCEGLIVTGKLLHINEFLLVQWLAPIASEAPEFCLAIAFAWRGQAGLALGSLLSSKLNQWTLLVGMIPGVYAVSHGSIDHPLPMGSFQLHEIFLTAAQSLLAVVLLLSLRLTLGKAMLLFVLFAGQLVLPGIVQAHPQWFGAIPSDAIHPIFSALYLIIAVPYTIRYRKDFLAMWEGLCRPRR